MIGTVEDRISSRALGILRTRSAKYSKCMSALVFSQLLRRKLSDFAETLRTCIKVVWISKVGALTTLLVKEVLRGEIYGG